MTRAFLKEYVDDVIQVSDRDAFHAARALCRREGISTGGSSGACLWAIWQYCRDLGKDDVVVTIFADGGIRYLSKMYNDEWMRDNGLIAESRPVKKERSV
jgi:cysteine synthase